MRVLLALLMFADVALGQSLNQWKGDGNALLLRCSAAELGTDDSTKKLTNAEAIDVASCIAYMQGIIEFDEASSALVIPHVACSKMKDEKGCTPYVRQTICIPEGVTVGRLARVVMKWLREHPEKLHYRASMVAYAAIYEAFPCK